MCWRAVTANYLADAQRQVRVENMSRPQHEQKDHPRSARLRRRPLLDSHRLADLRNLLQGSVDFSRPNPDAADIDHAIGPAVQPRGAVGVNEMKSPCVQNPGCWLK